MAVRRYGWVDYFPSYEIITGSHAAGRYYESDAREVSHLGVAHAMRCFFDNYVEGRVRPSIPTVTSAPRSTEGLICDEEAIEAVRA